MTRRLMVLVCVAVLSPPALVYAQDTPVVFVHGLAGSSQTWEATASRLQQQLAIRPYLAHLNWRQAIEAQAGELQGQYGNLPASAIAVGHSNGGLVIRQWNLVHPLAGALTVGTPNRGAPAVDNLHMLLRFNESLYNAVAVAGGAFGIDPATWNFVYVFVQGALVFSQQVAIGTVWGVAGLGLQTWYPVTGQMSTASYLINSLNSASNLAREEAQIARRVGLAYVANNYMNAGPARALDPDNADAIYAQMWAAIYTMEGVAAALHAYYPTTSTAIWIANALYNVAGWVRLVDPAWCGFVTNDFSCNTWHDGILPFSHQQYPGAHNIGIGGPAHLQEAKESGPIHHALTTFMGIQPRGTLPPGGQSGGNDELAPGQSLFPGQFRRSGNGLYEFTFQGDGNLVLYRMTDGAALWASGTYAPGGEAAMQGDGNLVVYNAENVALWHSETYDYPGARLFVQNDGNVVIYDAYNFPIWSTGTVQ